MNYRSIGRSGLDVSEIGFGAWGIGGDAYGPIDARTAVETVKAAVDSGVNFFDTSDVYGEGRSEEVLGNALGTKRDGIVISSKGGMLPHRGFRMPQDFGRAHLEAAVHASLRRLRTDHIDLYQLHSPTLAELESGEAIEALGRFKAQGWVGLIGVSARSPGDAQTMIERFDLDFIQVNFNLIDQRAATCGLLETARSRGIGVIARTPLCFGYLTGRLTGKELWGSLDHRSNWPGSQLERWAGSPGLFEHLYSTSTSTHASPRLSATATPCTAAQFALRFCLTNPGVSTVIPGMMNPEQVRENAAAADLGRLDASTLAEVESIYRAHEFYDRTIKAAA